jgi:murein DD-endopeptidase MepM/ murein hydrolase activator NlpD
LDTGFPQGSPFGGRNYDFSQKTAGFYDPAYYAIYGRQHDGLDIVPNSKYYTDNQAYKLTGKVIIFATCSGVAVSKVDGNGALYVSINCRDGNQVWLVHNSVNFVPTEPTQIRAGQPVGVMGETGMADGKHVHYGVRVKDSSGNYTLVNPEPYL